MLWTAKSLLNTPLPPAAKSVYSVPQFDRCRNKLHLRQFVKTSSNGPECEWLLDSDQLLCCSWCCWWWLFKSMTTEALSTPSAQTLIIHSFRCSTVFSCWHNPVSFLNIFIPICVTEHLWQWWLIWQRQSCCVSDLSTDVYFISDRTIMLFPGISRFSSLHYSSTLDRHSIGD